MDEQINAGSLNNRYHTTTCILGAFGSATDRQTYNIFNRYFTILNATFGTEADLQISLNNDPFTICFKSIQFDFRDYPVERITILNTNAAPNTVVLGFSAMSVVDNRTTVTGSVAVTGTVSVISPTAMVTQADAAVPTGVATKIYTSTGAEKQVFVQNLDALGGTSVRIGDSNVGAAQGVFVLPQQIIEFDVGGVGGGDIWAFHSKGSDLNVGVNKLT
jgi:hypothetical protein